MPELRDDDEPLLSREAFGSPMASPVQRLGNRLAILRTSRALKNEIEAELYRSRTLTFTIRPEWRGWRVENLPGSAMIDFVHTDFTRFKSIKVDIHCPQPDDPGQVLYARASIYNIVRLLRGHNDNIGQCEPYNTRNDQKDLAHYPEYKCKGDMSRIRVNIPRMEVRFLDEGLNTWDENGSSHYNFLGTPSLGADLKILTIAFGYLHLVQSISFTFPQTPRMDSHLAKIVKTVQKNVSNATIGSRDWNMIEFTTDEAEHYLGLDWALDTAPGPAAAILRRERLIHNRWYRRSVEYSMDLYANKREWHNPFERPTLERYRDFESLERSYLFLEEWRSFWPSGIPPKGSAGWNALIASASRF